MGTLYFVAIITYILFAIVVFLLIFLTLKKKSIFLTMALAGLWPIFLPAILVSWVVLALLTILVSPFMGEYDEDALVAH